MGLKSLNNPDELVPADEPETVPPDREFALPSRMAARQGRLLKWLGKAFFGAVSFDEHGITAIRDAHEAGTVVYVVNSHSLLDYLVFNFVFLRHGLPLVWFANGVNLLLFRPVRHVWLSIWRKLAGHRKRLSNTSAMKWCLDRHGTCLIFLKHPKTLIQWGAEYRIGYLKAMVEFQRDLERPMILVPLHIFWDHQPESYQRSIFDLVLGDPQAPGRVRKVLSFARNFRRARLIVGRSLNLRQFVTENSTADGVDAISARLKFALSNEFLLESKAIRGPVAKGSKRIVEEIVRTPRFIEDIETLARVENATSKAILSRARARLVKMVADFRFNWVEGFFLALGLIFQRMFTGITVDTDGLKAIRESAREAPIVLTPAHRSHLDFLVYSFVFYTHGLIPPHVAVGDNLSFWPIGRWLRRAGAFMIRGDTSREPLDLLILRHYVRKLLKDGYWMEFFIEERRSRTGKTGHPRTTLLSMIVDAVATGAAPNAFLVPSAATYERVVELGDFEHESRGGDKPKESVAGLARSAKVLGSRYGSMYVEFGDPINLVEYLKSHGVAVPLAEGDAVSRDVVRQLAHELMFRINREVVVTPQHVVAFVLLNHNKRGMGREKLIKRAGAMIVRLRQRGVLLSDSLDWVLKGHLIGENDLPNAPVLADTDVGGKLAVRVDEVLSLWAREKIVRLSNFSGDWVVSFEDEKRTVLDYYKNGVMHAFVPDALFAMAVLRIVDTEALDCEALRAHVGRLALVFRFEFAVGDSVVMVAAFDLTMKRLRGMGMIVSDEGRDRITRAGLDELDVFTSAMQPFVESYQLVGRIVLASDGSMSDQELVKAALKAGPREFSVGNIERAETVSAFLFENAVAYLRSEVEAGTARDIRSAADFMLKLL